MTAIIWATWSQPIRVAPVRQDLRDVCAKQTLTNVTRSLVTKIKLALMASTISNVDVKLDFRENSAKHALLLNVK